MFYIIPYVIIHITLDQDQLTLRRKEADDMSYNLSTIILIAKFKYLEKLFNFLNYIFLEKVLSWTDRLTDNRRMIKVKLFS